MLHDRNTAQPTLEAMEREVVLGWLGAVEATFGPVGEELARLRADWAREQTSFLPEMEPFELPSFDEPGGRME